MLLHISCPRPSPFVPSPFLLNLIGGAFALIHGRSIAGKCNCLWLGNSPCEIAPFKCSFLSAISDTK